MFADNATEELDPRFVARLRSFADRPLDTFDVARTIGAVAERPGRRPTVRLALGLVASGAAVAAIVVAAVLATGEATSVPRTGAGGTGAVAPDASFPVDYAVTSGWLPIGLATDKDWQFGSFDEAIAALRAYFAAGVRPVNESAVSITAPTVASATRDVRVFVQILGGTNANQAGEQFRVWLHRTDSGWLIDHEAEANVYCRVPLTRPSIDQPDMASGGLCL